MNKITSEKVYLSVCLRLRRCTFTLKMINREINQKYVTEIISLFVVREKQARFREFANSVSRYEDFLDELFIDPRNLQPNCLEELRGQNRSVDRIFVRLSALGSGRDAYVLSENLEVDGRHGKLRDILGLTVGTGIGTLVYCVGNPLGYYEDSEDFRYILSGRK